MSYNSSIEWTESSWNPVTGCTKISEGCKNCYAERMAIRLKAMKQKKYENGFELAVHEEIFDLPKSWVKPQMIFVNSMSDLFHESLSYDVIEKIFLTMNECNWHTFQVLTKRSNILMKYNNCLNWTKNIWMGVTVENDMYLERIDDLRRCGAQVKFISFEPLLSRIEEIDLTGIDWIIVGGESGPGSRTMEKEWVYEIRDMCVRQKVPFFFKQWGGMKKKKTAG